MPNPQEIAEITVNGMRFRDWELVTVKLAEGELNNTFRLTVSEGKPLSSKFADMQIRPGDHCTIKLAGELAITGYVETRKVAYTYKAHGIEIIGVSYTKATADGAAMTETGEFKNKSFKQIATEVLQPFGLQFVPKTPIPNNPFPRASIPPGQSAFDFLETLCAPARHRPRHRHRRQHDRPLLLAGRRHDPRGRRQHPRGLGGDDHQSRWRAR